MRWYLAGAMSGLPEDNYPAFRRVAVKLRAEGHEVLNPAELCGPQRLTWHECMEICLPFVIHHKTTGVFIIQEPTPHRWTQSDGACIEACAALAVGKEVRLYHPDPAERHLVTERYVHMRPLFSPIRDLEGLAASVTASGAEFKAIGVDARSEREPCADRHSRQAG